MVPSVLVDVLSENDVLENNEKELKPNLVCGARICYVLHPFYFIENVFKKSRFIVMFKNVSHVQGFSLTYTGKPGKNGRAFCS